MGAPRALRNDGNAPVRYDFAGPRGPSGVIARSWPSSTLAREPEQRARRAARRRAAHRSIAKTLGDAGDDLAVARAR